MPAFPQALAQNTLDAILATATFAATASPIKIKLTTTAPTQSAAGTELASSGYAAGGVAITFASATAATPTLAIGPPANIQWTNGSGSAWNIVGLDIVDNAAKRVCYGNWTGQPINVPAGNIFQISASGVTISHNG